MPSDLTEDVMHGVMTAIEASGFVRAIQLNARRSSSSGNVYRNQTTNQTLDYNAITDLVMKTVLPLSEIRNPDGTIIPKGLVTRAWSYHQTKARLIPKS